MVELRRDLLWQRGKFPPEVKGQVVPVGIDGNCNEDHVTPCLPIVPSSLYPKSFSWLWSVLCYSFMITDQRTENSIRHSREFLTFLKKIYIYINSDPSSSSRENIAIYLKLGLQTIHRLLLMNTAYRVAENMTAS